MWCGVAARGDALPCRAASDDTTPVTVVGNGHTTPIHVTAAMPCHPASSAARTASNIRFQVGETTISLMHTCGGRVAT